MYHTPSNPERATIEKLRKIINRNKNLDNLLISRSSLPTLVRAGLEFI
jgi:hypothetical protein